MRLSCELIAAFGQYEATVANSEEKTKRLRADSTRTVRDNDFQPLTQTDQDGKGGIGSHVIEIHERGI